MPEPTRPSALVVGAGLAGLTAALELAQRGASVEVWDPAPPGGRARSRTHAGAIVDLGPHALYTAGAAARHFAHLGLTLEGGSPAPLLLRRGDALHPFPTGAWSLLRCSGLAFPARLELAGVLLRLPRTRAEGSAAAWIDGHDHPDTRAFLRALARLSCYGGDLGRMDVGALLAQLRQATAGVRYLDGGWQRLVDALSNPARAAGVVFARHAARALRPSDTGWRVEARGAVREVPHVVLALPPSRAAELAPEPTPHAELPLRAAAARAEAVEVASLAVVLGELPRRRAPFALDLERPLYASVFSNAAELRLDPTDPRPRHVVQVVAYDPPHPVEALEAHLDLLQPGWRAHVLFRRFAPALTVHHGFPDHTRGGLAGRPPVALAPGLALAGDGVGSEGLLADAAVASALAAADHLLPARARSDAA